MTPANRKGRNRRNVPAARRVSPGAWSPLPLRGYAGVEEFVGESSGPVLAGLAGFAGGGLGSWLSDILKGKNDNPLGTVIGAAGKVLGGGSSKSGPEATVLPTAQFALANQSPAQSPNPASSDSKIPAWLIPAGLGMVGIIALAAVVRK